MKINKIHIISFGGLKNFTLEFSDGFNCVYGENERGKSTVMSFIKMMFYGNSYSGSVLQNNLRKKYTPWDGSAMAGIIEFEKDGKNYRLEREFKKSNSTDKVTLTDLNLGEKQTVSGDIGEKILGLSAGAFERSLFIGGLGFPDNDTLSESELNQRLSNMVSTGDEKTSLEEVTSKIEKARFSLISKSGRTGEFYRNLKSCEELNKKLEHSVEANKKYNEGKEKLNKFNAETEIIRKKAIALKEQISKEQDIKNAQKLQEYIKTKEELELLKTDLTLKDGSPADENYLRSLKFATSKLKNASALVKSKEKEAEIFKNQLDILRSGPKLGKDESAESLNSQIAEIEENIKSLREKSKETSQKIGLLQEKLKTAKPHFNPYLLAIGIILAVLSPMAFATFTLFVPLIICGLGIGFIVLSFILKPKSSKKQGLISEDISSLQGILENQTYHIEDLKNQIAEKSAKVEAIRISANASMKVIDDQRQKLADCEAELIQLKNAEQTAAEELNGLLNRLNTETDNLDETIQLLENSTRKQKELKQHINFLLSDLNNITYDEAKVKLSQIEANGIDESIDLTAVKEEFETLSNEITKRLTAKATAETELKALLTGLEPPAVLETTLKEKSELLQKQKDFCDCADIALEVLRESFGELRSTYGSKLEKKTAEIFSAITNGKYSGVTVSKSFKINVESKNNPISREAEYLSSGTFDQVYLSLRLAVTKLLEEKLPLFLDDTLSQYDDNRAKRTAEFLKGATANSQAIMFTCHKSIEEICKNLSCNIIDLK